MVVTVVKNGFTTDYGSIGRVQTATTITFYGGFGTLGNITLTAIIIDQDGQAITIPNAELLPGNCGTRPKIRTE
jgi:hypothetical protein